MIRAYCINLISTALFCLLGYSHGKTESFPGLFGKGLCFEKHIFNQQTAKGRQGGTLRSHRRGKAARATRALVDTVREAAGFPRE